MAPSTDGAVAVSLCKRCKSKVVTGYKCKNCESYFHVSCAKLSCVKFVEGNVLVCCENEGSEAAFFDAIDNYSDENNKIDVGIFNYVIKQKDALISELKEQIKLLNSHIYILNKCAQNGSDSLDKDGIKPPQKVCETRGEARNDGHSNKKHENVSRQKSQKVPEPTKNNNIDNLVVQTKNVNNSISKKEVSMAVLEAQTQEKLNKYINLAEVDATPSNSKTEAQWEQVKRKKSRRNIVIGSNKSGDIKGVPKYVDLHVCRVNPETSAVDLTRRLNCKFPEVKCQTLNSKQPDLYSSFKVSIFGSNFKEAMCPEIWPDGVVISRFLYPRKKTVLQET